MQPSLPPSSMAPQAMYIYAPPTTPVNATPPLQGRLGSSTSYFAIPDLTAGYVTGLIVALLAVGAVLGVSASLVCKHCRRWMAPNDSKKLLSHLYVNSSTDTKDHAAGAALEAKSEAVSMTSEKCQTPSHTLSCSTNTAVADIDTEKGGAESELHLQLERLSRISTPQKRMNDSTPQSSTASSCKTPKTPTSDNAPDLQLDNFELSWTSTYLRGCEL